MTIDDISAGYVSGQSEDATLGVYVELVRGGYANNLINGWHTFRGSSSIEILYGHFETGGIDADGASVSVRKCEFYTEQGVVDSGRYGVLLRNDDANNTSSRRKSEVIDCEFRRLINRRGGWPAVDVPDIRVEDAECAFYERGNTRIWSISGNNSRMQISPAYIGDGTTIWEASKNYAHVTFREDTFIAANTIPVTGTVQRQPDFDGWANATAPTLNMASWGVTWDGPTGLLRCAIQQITDWPRRIGRNAITVPECTVTVTNGSSLLPFLQGTRRDNTQSNLIYRIYLSPIDGSAGEYDKVVNIPAVNLWRFLVNCDLDDDTGTIEEYGINGFPLESRPLGPVDDLNPGATAGRARYTEGRLHLEVSNTSNNPSEGDGWLQGDALERIDITPPGTGLTVINGTRRITNGGGSGGVGHVDGDDWMRTLLHQA